MADRKIEYSKLSIRVIGTRLKEGASEATRYSYDVNLDSALCNRAKKSFEEQGSFVAQVTEKRGKKYQEVAIEEIKVVDEKKFKFYHFSLAYIKRDRDDILTKNLGNAYKTRKIKLGEKEFEFIPLHLTIEPLSGTILLDAKCHTGPTETFLHQLLLPLLDPNEYGFTTEEQLDEKLRVCIKPNLRQDYESVLKNKFRQIEEMQITVAKPTAAQKNVSKEIDASHVRANKKVMKAVGELISGLFGGNSVADRLEDLPFKRLKLSLAFDDPSKSSEVAKYKKLLKSNSGEFIESDYIRQSVLTYKDDQEHGLQKALLSGALISRSNGLESKYHTDNTKMWTEHRRVFFEVRKELDAE